VDPFLGQILVVGFNFAPEGWALCNGQLMSISQNTALFSLLGTFYGGDGVSTFALPNLQGRVVIGQGNGAGLSPYVVGQLGGSQTAALSVANMPAHSHTFNVATDRGTYAYPANKALGGNPDDLMYSHLTSPAAQMDAGVIGNTGGGANGAVPFSIIPPYIALTCIIALTGIFPSRG
jgi:microcystin-dependent protein